MQIISFYIKLLNKQLSSFKNAQILILKKDCNIVPEPPEDQNQQIEIKIKCKWKLSLTTNIPNILVKGNAEWQVSC